MSLVVDLPNGFGGNGVDLTGSGALAETHGRSVSYAQGMGNGWLRWAEGCVRKRCVWKTERGEAEGHVHVSQQYFSWEDVIKMK